MMIWIYSLTIFISASLLFLIQPIIAKLILPVFGSSSQVWTTSVMFFQCVLLAGYFFAHLLSTIRKKGIGILVFVCVILLPVLTPLEYDRSAFKVNSPTLSLLYILISTIGIHFFLLSTCSPLLQHWLSLSRLRSSANPYFLYAISNFGSLTVLLAYPFLVEPFSTLSAQMRHWNYLYIALAALVVVVGAFTYINSQRSDEAETGSLLDAIEDVSIRRVTKWVFWAFVPSGLMLSVSTFLSNEIASIPLLWIIPLFLYLLTMTIVFIPNVKLPIRGFILTAPILIVTTLMLLTTQAVEPLTLIILLFVTTLFVIAMVCHWELVQDKPTPRHLTLFYLAVSFGGALGGVFTAIVSPLVFNDYYEFPLLLLLAAGALPPRDPAVEKGSTWRKNLGFGLVPVAAMLTIVIALQTMLRTSVITQELLGFLGKILVIPVPFLLCYLAVYHRRRFVISLFSCTVAGFLLYGASTNHALLFQERTFYGVHKVLADKQNERTLLWHGATVHGIQSDKPEVAHIPAAYFHPTGPAGDIFLNFNTELNHIAVVGLGAGSLSGYGRPGTRFDYYEIDEIVIGIAGDKRFFTYVEDAARRNSRHQFYLGDARLTLEGAENASYDLIVLDAFSSGSIPTHLLTMESLALYARKLRPSGMILFHISNNFLDLSGLLCTLAGTNNMACLTKSSGVENEAQRFQSKMPSRWLVMTSDPQKAKTISNLGWQTYGGPAMKNVWTDNYSSILHVLR
ncbi:spermidine synthase [Pseudomonadota bacterium]